MYAKIAASMLMAIASAEREAAYARCELMKDSSDTANDVSGKFLIADFEDTDIFVTGNIFGLANEAEYYVTVTDGQHNSTGDC